MINFISKSDQVGFIDRTPAKTQGKEITINKNGVYSVAPDGGYLLNGVKVNADIPQELLSYASNLTQVFMNATLPDDYIFTLLFKEETQTNLTNILWGTKGVQSIILKTEPGVEKIINATAGFRNIYRPEGKEISFDISQANIRFSKLDRSFYYSSIRDFTGVFKLTEDCLIGRGFDVERGIDHIEFEKGTIHTDMEITHCPYISNEALTAIVNGYADMNGKPAPILKLRESIDVSQALKDELKRKNITLIRANG